MNTVCANCQALNRIPDDRMEDGAKCGRCGHELFDGDVINATGATLDKLLKDDLPVVIDFWAPWCGPCRMVSPIVDEIAEENSAIKVAKINIDEQPQLASQYGVMSIPTLMLFENGDVVDKAVGARNKSFILQMLEG